MKLQYILISFLLCTSCSTINFHFFKDHRPDIEHLHINTQTAGGDYSRYKTGSGSIYLKILEKDENGIVVKIQDSFRSDQFAVNGTLPDLSSIFYEYHFDPNGTPVEAWLVDGKKRTALDLNTANETNTEEVIVSGTDGYSITTNAGTFSCSMNVTRDHNVYTVTFLNRKLPAGTVRCFVLTDSQYKNFSKLDKRSQQSFLTEDMLEVYETRAK